MEICGKLEKIIVKSVRVEQEATRLSPPPSTSLEDVKILSADIVDNTLARFNLTLIRFKREINSLPRRYFMTITNSLFTVILRDKSLKSSSPSLDLY